MSRLPILLLPLCLAAPLRAAEPALPPVDPAGAEAAFTEGLKAREAGDIATYRARIERAASLLPDNSRLLYRLAGARLLDGDRAGALEAMGRQVDAAMFRDPRKDADFAALAGDPAFVALMARMEGLLTPLVASAPAFEGPERDLLVEGIAYDAASKSYFLSSVRQGKILRRSADGSWSKVAGFDGAKAGSPLGIALDAARGKLWVASAALPHGSAPEAMLKRGAVTALDVASGKAATQTGLLPVGQSANDVVVAKDGTAFASDPGATAIVRIGSDGSRQVLIEGNGLRSPGGLALSADEKLLYVADWTNGFAVLDLDSKKLEWIRPAAGSTVLGIDGLAWHGRDLIAIQNGVYPARIQRLRLSGDGRSIASAETLERAVTEWDEPTLGVVVDAALVYVATSQWPRYGEDGKPASDPATWPLPQIRRLALR